MQHTIAAVFNTQGQAQKACEALISAGFARDEVHLSQSDEPEDRQASSEQHQNSESAGSGIKSFFAELFGSHQAPDADLYSQAVMQGNYVLTVNVPDDNQVEEATEVLDQFDPLDIDEEASNWKSGGWAAAESMRRDENPSLTQQSPAGINSTPSSMATGKQSRESMNAASAMQQRSTKASSGANANATTNEQQAIPVVQEELNVGKRTVQRGGVRVYQRVIEKPVQETLSLSEERVSVQRRPVNQPADASALKEGTFEMRETAEEPVVQKVARVVEEVVIGKEVKQRQQQINDTVRSTQVDVEQLSGTQVHSGSFDQDNDAYFRNHWNSNYASSGDTYEDYAPAYRYGSSLSSSDRYQGKQWADVEPDVRRDWESKNPGSTWEKIKEAVRHGWDRMTS